MLKPGFEKTAEESPAEFREALAGWFSVHGKDYPWRRTTDPYAILVSEVMLQQTQIATVLGKGYYTRFLACFPDVASLASAEDEPLLKAWEGLGYYRRARMLRSTARAVLDGHGGVFPVEEKALLALPGVGPYTAAAVRAFAHDLPAAVVDGNVARVLSRMLDFSGAVDDTAGQKWLRQRAEGLADPVRPRVFNSALMELGQTFCRPGVPDCLSCPVSRFCRTRVPETLPVKKLKTTITPVDEHALWLLDDAGRLLMHRESGKRREGLWRLPSRPPAELEGCPVLTEEIYPITRYRVTMKVHEGDPADFSGDPEAGEAWFDAGEVGKLPMPAPYRRVISRLLGGL